MPAAELLLRLADGAALSAEDADAAFGEALDGSWGEAELAALLTALRLRGETADELFGAASALRRRAAPLDLGVPGLLDTCGTGGDHAGTFNISTAAALVAAAAGAKVAKHGNRAVSSSSGSADVLECLGVPLLAEPDAVRASLGRFGFAFFFAPHWHPAMAVVRPLRRRLGFRTLFNLLGPLCNPAGAERQVVGVGRRGGGERLLDPMAEALQRLGVRNAVVVQGSDGLDEATLAGPTAVRHVTPEGIAMLTWTPEDFGLPRSTAEAWQAADAKASAAILRGIFAGEKGPPRDIVLANAAAALWTAGQVSSLAEGVAQAADALDRGAVAQLAFDLAAAG